MNLDPTPIWQYIPLSEYRVPGEAKAQSFRNKVQVFFEKFNSKSENSYQSIKDLQGIPVNKLEKFIPDPDLTQPVDALSACIEANLSAPKRLNPCIFVIGTPCSFHAQILTELAKKNNWRIIRPPAADRIFKGDGTWFSQFSDTDTVSVLPDLEKCFFRHVNGLALIRSIFEMLWKGASNLKIIGCDSWAWSYLSRALTCIQAPETLIAQAFDQERLSRLFQPLSPGIGSRHVNYRQSDNGRWVIHPFGRELKADEKIFGRSDYLEQLAQYSRGNPGIAHSFWRRSLQFLPDKNFEETSNERAEEKSDDTIWVMPWKDVKKPSMPVNVDRKIAMVVHALLIHRGLTEELLDRLMPFSRRIIMSHIRILYDNDILELSNGHWHISASGYPAARRFLNDEGYLVGE